MQDVVIVFLNEKDTQLTLAVHAKNTDRTDNVHGEEIKIFIDHDDNSFKRKILHLIFTSWRDTNCS